MKEYKKHRKHGVKINKISKLCWPLLVLSIQLIPNNAMAFTCAPPKPFTLYMPVYDRTCNVRVATNCSYTFKKYSPIQCTYTDAKNVSVKIPSSSYYDNHCSATLHCGGATIKVYYNHYYSNSNVVPPYAYKHHTIVLGFSNKKVWLGNYREGGASSGTIDCHTPAHQDVCLRTKGQTSVPTGAPSNQ